MAIDRDAVTSLELLAPTRSRAALQKAIASTASASGAAAAAAAVLQAAQQDMPLGTQGTGASRPIAGTQGRYATGSSNYTRGRRRASCKAAAAASCSSSKGSSSLFGFLNHTATACGARLLRTNLLQPLTDITTLELRLDSLQVCGTMSIKCCSITQQGHHCNGITCYMLTVWNLCPVYAQHRQLLSSPARQPSVVFEFLLTYASVLTSCRNNIMQHGCSWCTTLCMLPLLVYNLALPWLLANALLSLRLLPLLLLLLPLAGAAGVPSPDTGAGQPHRHTAQEPGQGWMAKQTDVHV